MIKMDNRLIQGSALLFFPSCGGAPDCPFDVRTLHAGEVCACILSNVCTGPHATRFVSQHQATPVLTVSNRAIYFKKRRQLATIPSLL